MKLGAVNSINWSRILAQIVYYFRSYFLLAEASSFSIGDHVKIVTPTGNFGNILAGYFAKKMGLPVDTLVGMLVSTFFMIDWVVSNNYLRIFSGNQ